MHLSPSPDTHRGCFTVVNPPLAAKEPVVPVPAPLPTHVVGESVGEQTPAGTSTASRTLRLLFRLRPEAVTSATSSALSRLHSFVQWFVRQRRRSKRGYEVNERIFPKSETSHATLQAASIILAFVIGSCGLSVLAYSNRQYEEVDISVTIVGVLLMFFALVQGLLTFTFISRALREDERTKKPPTVNESHRIEEPPAMDTRKHVLEVKPATLAIANNMHSSNHPAHLGQSFRAVNAHRESCRGKVGGQLHTPSVYAHQVDRGQVDRILVDHIVVHPQYVDGDYLISLKK